MDEKAVIWCRENFPGEYWETAYRVLELLSKPQCSLSGELLDWIRTRRAYALLKTLNG
jgi:hypothetical protein